MLLRKEVKLHKWRLGSAGHACESGVRGALGWGCKPHGVVVAGDGSSDTFHEQVTWYMYSSLHEGGTELWYQ